MLNYCINLLIRRDLKTVFDKLSEDSKCRAIVLSGAGKMFSGGKFLIIQITYNKNSHIESIETVFKKRSG